jgi:hypothetical protein
LRKEALRKLERAGNRHDRSMNDELAERIDASFRLEETEQTLLDLLSPKQVASRPMEQTVGLLIALAALGGPEGRRASMAAIRTEQGSTEALKALGMTEQDYAAGLQGIVQAQTAKEQAIIEEQELMAEAQAEVAAAVSANEGLQPLDYMLAVMRDPTASEARRNMMAKAAASAAPTATKTRARSRKVENHSPR